MENKPAQQGDKYTLHDNQYEVKCFWVKGNFYNTLGEALHVTNNIKDILIENTIGGFTELEFSFLAD